MKKLIATLVFVSFFVIGYSQSDTLYNRKRQKIPCKIIEINELDIKYKPAGSDGPMYTVNKTTIIKYTLANGFSEVLLPDELSLENEHLDIIKNRSAIKIHPFSPANSQISLAYEKVIKVGMNLDVEAGYSNSSINKYPVLGNNYNSGVSNSGFYVKPGLKFFLGHSYSVRGLKYAHPLKGQYIKLDVALAFMNFQKLEFYQNYNQPPSTTNLNAFAYGGFVNYGRQFILGNLLTMEYYVGVGFTGQSISYTNPQFTSNPNSYNYGDYGTVSNYHGFLRSPGGLSFTCGFRVGYIIPEKKSKAAKKQSQISNRDSH